MLKVQNTIIIIKNVTLYYNIEYLLTKHLKMLRPMPIADYPYIAHC